MLLFAGGVLVPASAAARVRSPSSCSSLPSGALAEGLRTALLGGTPALGHIVVLIVWAVVAGGIATRTVRWT